ncbi:hypothetical protein [Winogradskyella sp.]|uniref:hypothetical protein n=1 Tax=Winogradskyella sp. TaxID=1883156 RepID=UPI003BAAB509
MKVEIGDTQNEYQLYFNQQNGQEIKGIFTKWKGDFATDITITKNDVTQFHIEEIHYINLVACDGHTLCFELQLKAIYDDPNIGPFPIKNNLSFNAEVVLIHYEDPEEIQIQKCSCNYAQAPFGGIPSTKKGSILQGGK